MHSWLSALLPDVPPRPTHESSGQLYYKAGVTGAIFSASYSQGKAVILR